MESAADQRRWTENANATILQALNDGNKSSNPCDQDKFGGFVDSETIKPQDLEHPPNERTKGWVVVLCSHLIVMNTWGFSNSFGAFQTYFVDSLNRKASDISWIGSIQIFLLFFLGTFTGRLTDVGYFRYVFIIGTISTLVGVFVSSVCSQYWHFLLTLGCAVGIGNGCLFCPMLTVMSAYFDKRRSIAIAVVACGSATGGIIYPVVVRQLLPSAGFPWTMRTIGFIQLATLISSNIWLRPCVAPRSSGPLLEWKAFKEPTYAFYATASFFCLFSLYFSFFFLGSFSRTALNPPFTYKESLDLLLLLNGISVVGRLGAGYIADKFGTINVFIPVAATTSILLYSWAAVHNSSGIYVWTSLCGIASGGVQSLFPATLSSLTSDKSKMGVRMGMVFSIVSFASLIGPPIVAALVKATSGKYLASQILAGSSMLLSAGFLGAARYMSWKLHNTKNSNL